MRAVDIVEAIEKSKEEMLKVLDDIFAKTLQESHPCEDTAWHRCKPEHKDDWEAIDHFMYTLLMMRLESDQRITDEISMALLCFQGNNIETATTHIREVARHQKMGAILSTLMRIDMELGMEGKRVVDATEYLAQLAAACRETLNSRLATSRIPEEALRRTYEEKFGKPH